MMIIKLETDDEDVASWELSQLIETAKKTNDSSLISFIR